MGDITVSKNRMKETLGKDLTTEVEHALTDMVITYYKAAADSMASDTTADTKFYTNPFDFKLQVVSGKLSLNAALTAHASNYAEVNVKTDDGADSAPAIALQWSTDADVRGNIAADTPIDATTNTQANATLPVGGNLWYAIAKAGAGVVVPISLVAVRLRRRD